METINILVVDDDREIVNAIHYDAKSGRTYNYHEDTKRKKHSYYIAVSKDAGK